MPQSKRNRRITFRWEEVVQAVPRMAFSILNMAIGIGIGGNATGHIGKMGTGMRC